MSDPREDVARELGFDTYADLRATVAPQQWLAPRLERASERERRKLLAEIGAESVDDARARIAEASELRARLESAHEALTYVLADCLSPLTTKQQDVVCALGEGEPIGVIKAIQALLPFWRTNTNE